MIIQGSNNPLVIEFDQDVSGYQELLVSLWSGSDAEPAATWLKSGGVMQVDGCRAICPISMEQSAALDAHHAVVEVKGLDEDGNTQFWTSIKADVLQRRDKDLQFRLPR